MKRALGFHGTTVATAKKLTVGAEPFKVQHNEGDWLGPGAYFWQDAPGRARSWARRNFGVANAAVLSAEINLNHCLDLLDLADFSELKAVQDAFEDFATKAGYTYVQTPLKVVNGVTYVPKGRRKAPVNDRDQALLAFALPLIEKVRGKKVKVVRSAFLYGRAFHRTSFLFDWAHIQICVLEPYVAQIIKKIRVVTEYTGG
jgi:hypothetical protein